MADIDCPLPTNYAQWTDPLHNDNTRLAYLNELSSVTQTWTLIATDLLAINFNPLMPAHTALRNRLRYLLRFYYDGAVYFSNFIQAIPPPLAGPVAAGLATLQGFIPPLGVALTALGDNLAVARPVANNRWSVPSAQTIELLTQAMWITLAAAPPTLVALQQGMLATNVVINQRAGGAPAGLPIVVFGCEQHALQRCSSDNYVNLNPLRTDAKNRRQARFLPAGNRGPHSQYCQISIDRYNAVRTWSGLNIPNFVADATNRNLTNQQYNDFINDMYGNRGAAGPPGGVVLPPTHGFVHTGEPGRSFYGSGAIMFDAMSRCWKCRFNFHYNTLYPVNPVPLAPHLPAEDPRQTVWAANQPLACAEDLTHWSCTAAGGGVGAQGAAPNAYVFIPF